jgi:hypothetical protein
MENPEQDFNIDELEDNDGFVFAIPSRIPWREQMLMFGKRWIINSFRWRYLLGAFLISFFFTPQLSWWIDKLSFNGAFFLHLIVVQLILITNETILNHGEIITNLECVRLAHQRIKLEPLHLFAFLVLPYSIILLAVGIIFFHTLPATALTLAGSLAFARFLEALRLRGRIPISELR